MSHQAIPPFMFAVPPHLDPLEQLIYVKGCIASMQDLHDSMQQAAIIAYHQQGAPAAALGEPIKLSSRTTYAYSDEVIAAETNVRLLRERERKEAIAQPVRITNFISISRNKND